jgi:ribonuclease HIII
MKALRQIQKAKPPTCECLAFSKHSFCVSDWKNTQGDDKLLFPNAYKQFLLPPAYSYQNLSIIPYYILLYESDQGDYFRGLVTAGVIIDPEAIPLLQSL